MASAPARTAGRCGCSRGSEPLGALCFGPFARTRARSMSDHSIKGRLEDRRYITGSGRYTADRNLPGQLYAYFVRSDRPHAEIVAIDAGTARTTPGVHLVLTGEDVKAAGVKTLPVNSIAGKS